MMILAFDTAMAACSAGVWRDGEILASESLDLPQGHAEALMPMIERVMSAAHTTYAALDRIAVTVGPGSFTGLRVGLATAHGLAMASQKPAIGITTCEALAAAARAKTMTRVLCVIDSKRDDVYAQAFAVDGTPETEILNVGYDALRATFPGPVCVVGDAAARAITHFGADAVLSDGSRFCDIAHIAQIASTRAVDPRGLLPVYVRAPDITLRADGGALRP